MILIRSSFFFLLGACLCFKGSGQYKWKQVKDKDGIRVFLSDIAGRSYKAVRVECTFPGTYQKLFSLLDDIPNNKDWVYNLKNSRVLKRLNPLEYWIHSETHLPWPMSNRDAVIHVRMHTDSLPHFFTRTGTGEPKLIPESSGLVRVPHYYAYWKVTMPASQMLHIEYLIEADPGGSIPAWLSNMFVDKGPYETFKKLKELLQK